MIDAKNINVKFGKRQILKDLNLKVKKGEINNRKENIYLIYS